MEAMQLLMEKRRSTVHLGDMPEVRYSLEELKPHGLVDPSFPSMVTEDRPSYPSMAAEAIFRGSRLRGLGQKSRRLSEGNRPHVLHSLESLKRDLCADVLDEEQRQAQAAPALTSAFTPQEVEEELDPDFSLVSLQEVRRLLREELLPVLREVQRGPEAVGSFVSRTNGAARPRQCLGQAGWNSSTAAIQAALRDEFFAGLVELRGGAVQEEREDAEPRCPIGHVLRAAKAPNDTYSCDKCQARVPSGTVLWGCRRCNYDECQSCCGRALPSEAADKADGDEESDSSSDSWGDDSDDDLPPEAKRKLIICVRSDIKMSIGKTAAQVGHAVHSAVRRSTWSDLQAWEACGAKKVTLRVDSQDELLELRRAARAAGLIAESIRDAGHTELEPGTMTVLAIGPAQEANIDLLTGHLRPLPDTLLRENEKLKAQNAKLQSELDSVRKEKKGLRQDKLRLLKLLSVKDRYV